MGLTCSKRKLQGVPLGHVRPSPFGKFGRRNSIGSRPLDDACDIMLLQICLHAATENLHTLPLSQLRALPTDLSQLILNRLIEQGRLNDAAVLRLQGLHFHELVLDAYPEPIRDFWLRYLATQCLERAIIRKTTIDDMVLSALPSTLPSLHTLHLDFCLGLTDAGLPCFQNLPHLKDLSLAGCDGITHQSMLWIARLQGLTSLNLEQCHNVTGLEALISLQQLEHINLGWCSNVGDNDVINGISKLSQTLKSVRICHTSVADGGVKYLKSLTGLTSLSLGGLRVSDHAVCAVLKCIPGLKVLDLERCLRVSDGVLRVLGCCAKQLQDLDLAYTNVSDDGLDALGPLSALTRVNLDSCGVGDRGLEVLSRLINLENLDLSDTSITAASMYSIAKLEKLHSLNLSFTNLDNSGLRKLSAVTSLKRLNLDSRHFTDSALPHVAKLSNLHTLDLFGASITDAGCVYLSNMSALTSLEICSGVITDAGVARLAALSSLRHLSLNQNYRVSNSSIPHLIKLSHLTSLNLSQCRITSTAIVAVGCLPELQVLALHGTRVRHIAVEKLKVMNPNLEVAGIKMPDIDID